MLLGAFAFLFPPHQALVVIQPVATTTIEAQAPVKPVTQAKPSLAAAPPAPIVVPAIPAPIAIPVVAPVPTLIPTPVKSAITVPPVLAKPHPNNSISYNQVQIRKFQDDYDGLTANIKSLQNNISSACASVNTNLSSYGGTTAIAQGNLNIALEQRYENCQDVTEATNSQIQAYKDAQATDLQKIQDLQNDPIQ